MRRAPMLALALLLACTGAESGAGGPAAATVTLEQFQLLRWVQGNWRGTEAGAEPFFESYVFVDDSTVRSFTYADSTFAQARDSGLVLWRGGEVSVTGGAARWVAVSFDSSGVEFSPVLGASNLFRWAPESHDRWTAELAWPGTGAKSRTYLMERVGS